MSSADESISLTITECETALSYEDSESSPVIFPEYHNSFVNGLAELIKNFKTRALLLEDEQESLLATLLNLRNECTMTSPTAGQGLGEESVDAIDDLTQTLMDITLKVTTKRSIHEEEALYQVNHMINHLVSKVQEEVHHSKELCHVYIRSCYKPGQCTEETLMNDDDSFQSIILRCSSDDKHRIRRRLHGLLKYIDSRLENIYPPTLDLSKK